MGEQALDREDADADVGVDGHGWHTDLLELKAVVDLLRRVLHDDAARLWLRSPNPDLNYEKPLDLVAAGDYQRVVDLLLALAEGVTG